MLDLSSEIVRRNSTPRMIAAANAAALVEDRHRERLVTLPAIEVERPAGTDSKNGNHSETRVCAVMQRVPLVFASGEPYGVLAVIVPILLHGSAEAFEGDKRVATASFDLSMIPSPKGRPVVMNVSFSPAWFTGDKVLYERPDMLPVILK